jgi:hypothetical protein
MRALMRTLLATAIFAGGLAASIPDAARRSWRGANAPYKAVRPPYVHRGNAVCQERARFFDPNRTFGGFLCWARSAFGQGRW